MNERSAALLLAIIAGYNMWVIVAKHQPFRYAPTIDLAPMVQGMIVCLLGFMACITVSTGKAITAPPQLVQLVYWDGIIPRIRTGQQVIEPYLTSWARDFINFATTYLFPALFVLTLLFVVGPVLAAIGRVAFDQRPTNEVSS
ncbi:hypothetical protein [Mycobacteroides abscessus]|uniref:hypothetical protein n=1 Tax=Mycobacteroides abscessus TaxID=36809 RepID=UPI00092B6033|nr:hypothetical protein [Mycobacteroides abscessus]MBN7488254.1 hypothetical protein [Mycobacteroides abscessus subsp. abscessus]RIS36619.1 hypothetical protein D2E71_26565 [Mycobacteroides abscessus]RIS77939.1 hypothetical protein D2E54_15415 [Mycobacteroides abscessus]SIA49057.1 Uncharacterised protein [Mycobacteroides abscessus subsp. abscessus]SIA69905.1 Uncharacterised protein [Mycobacteroides abscessus subsp. abscessus]